MLEKRGPCTLRRAMGEFVLSSMRSASLLVAYLRYIMCDRWVMDPPPPSLHYIISDKSPSSVPVGSRLLLDSYMWSTEARWRLWGGLNVSLKALRSC